MFLCKVSCQGQVSFAFFKPKMTLPVLLFPKELLSDNIFITDDESLFVHYHGIMYSARDNN